MSITRTPRIYCAQCGLHVDLITVEEDIRTMQAIIRVECHGQMEVKAMDGYQFLEIVRSDIAGTAFENKLEDHSDGQATNQADSTGPSVPGKTMALRGV